MLHFRFYTIDDFPSALIIQASLGIPITVYGIIHQDQMEQRS